jgi:primase-polymerase (primpol)-like protein
MGSVAMDPTAERPLAEAALSARDPQRHASTKDRSTWSDYATALAAVQAGKADGVSFMMTEADPLAAIDLDHCRDPDTHSINVWAQNFLDVARHTYQK